MSKSIRRIWPHAAVFGVVLAFFFYAPVIWWRFSRHEGNPVRLDGSLPAPTEDVRYSIDGMKDAGKGVFLLSGWAFLTEAGNYSYEKNEREIVLSSDSRDYAFPIEPAFRLDVDSTFAEGGMDLKWSGFSSLIFKDALKPDSYSVGILFKDSATGSAFFFDTQSCITRTPNQLVLQISGASPCRLATPTEGANTEVSQPSPRLDIALPSPTDQGCYDIEELVPYHPAGIYRLTGWAFLTLDPEAPASQYARRIVLLRGDQTYVFHANAVSREDIETRFNEAQANLRMSGFTALIDPGTLLPGEYRLGVLLTDRKKDQDFLLLTSRYLNRTEKTLELGTLDSPVCNIR